MNYFKRGIASLTRRKSKTLILFAVIFVLGNVMAGAISIQQATKQVETNIKTKLGGKGTITVDQKEMDKAMAEDEGEQGLEINWKSIKPSVIEEIGALPTVKYFDYSRQDYISTKDFKMYESPEEKAQKQEEDNSDNSEENPFPNNFNYRGVNYPGHLDIETKAIQLVDGRTFQEKEIESGIPVALISKQVAELNQVKVGDKLILDVGEVDYTEDNKAGVEPKSVSQKQVFELIGLYEPIVKEEKKTDKNQKNSLVNMFRSDSENFNNIYLPNQVVSANAKSFRQLMWETFPNIKKEIEEGLAESKMTLADIEEDDYLKPTFILNHPDDSEAFRTDATALLPDKFSKIILSTDQYDSVAGPVKNMAKMSKYVITISIIASILIISLVVLLFLRDRKHELGIYLSLGEKRGKVLGQIMIEVLAIGVLAMTLSVVSGNVLAKQVSTSLVTTQLNEEQEKMSEGGVMFDGESYALQELTEGAVDESDVAESYQVQLTPGYITLFYVVGMGTILLATILPLTYILRLNPKKIMM